MELPSDLTQKANLRGKEFAWAADDFPGVVSSAQALGYGCLGGQFQFRLPGATCEMYWLSADPDERTTGETWREFSARSCAQTLERFNATLAAANFVAEAQRWADVPQLSGPSAKPLEHLCFVAYFVNEQQMSNSSFKPNPLRGSA